MIYLDSAATSYLKPECVSEAVAASFGLIGNAGRGAHGAALNASRLVYDSRLKLACFFGVRSPEQVVFTAGITQSLNTVIKGLLKPGDHVITSLTEHNSVLRPLYCMEEEGVEISFLPADENGTVMIDSLPAMIRPDTRAVILSHASNVTGNVVDIGKVSEIIHGCNPLSLSAKPEGHPIINGVQSAGERKGSPLLIVDSAQTAGGMDINVEEMGIDILAFTGHKSLLGPQGVGGIVFGDDYFLRLQAGEEIKESKAGASYREKDGEVDITRTIKPLMTGGSGIHSFDKRHPSALPEALEAGTLNGHGIAGLKAALEYIESVGVKNIQSREYGLYRRFIDGVSKIPGIRIYGDSKACIHAPIVILNVGDMDAAYVSDILWEDYGIAIRPGAHCAPLMHEHFGTVDRGACRFSFSYFNTEEEIDTAIKALKSIV